MWERLEKREIARRGLQPGPGERPRADLAHGTDLVPQIKHIVVLMMENHSFDNYLGTLGRGEGFPLGGDGRPEAENLDSAGTAVRAFHAGSTVQEQPGAPGQSWSASHAQWGGGKLDGFVTSTEQAAPGAGKAAAMGYWTAADLPFYHGLARTFPLADHWFSSCLGPTFPNRRFLLAGTANGLMDDLPVNLLDRPAAGTIMDMLTRHGISWVNYRPAGPGQSEFGRYVRYRRRRIRHQLAHFGRPFAKTGAGFKRDLQFTTAIYPLGMASYMAHVRSTERFFADADSGNLPSFCIVDPDFRSFSEENGPIPCSSGPMTSTAAITTTSPRPPRCRPTTSGGAAGSRTRPRSAGCSRCCSLVTCGTPSSSSRARIRTIRTVSGCRPCWCRPTRGRTACCRTSSTTPRS